MKGCEELNKFSFFEGRNSIFMSKSHKAGWSCRDQKQFSGEVVRLKWLAG